MDQDTLLFLMLGIVMSPMILMGIGIVVYEFAGLVSDIWFELHYSNHEPMKDTTSSAEQYPHVWL